MWNKENSYKLKQEVFLDQCCLHFVKWSIASVVPPGYKKLSSVKCAVHKQTLGSTAQEQLYK